MIIGLNEEERRERYSFMVKLVIARSWPSDKIESLLNTVDRTLEKHGKVMILGWHSYQHGDEVGVTQLLFD